MEHKYIYVGCFIPYEELHEKIKNMQCMHLDRMIKTPHVTFAYKPDEVHEELFGEKVKIVVIGYGNDKKNEGLKVELESANPELKKQIDNIEVPHITLSVGTGGASVNTRYLDFSPVDKIILWGTYGGYDANGEVVLKGL